MRLKLKWREPIDYDQVRAGIKQALSYLQAIPGTVSEYREKIRTGKWGLKEKLVGIMLALTFASALLLFILDSYGVKEIARAIQNQNEDLSQAFQISVDEITTQGFTNQARLQDFIGTLKRKGLKEISILSNERQVLESSNPQKVGKVIPPKHKDFLVTGALGDEENDDGSRRKIYNLVIPVVVKNEQIGYVNLKLHLEDLDSLLGYLKARRMFAIIIVFVFGAIGAVFFASRYTKPIGALVEAARRIAAGDLSKKVEVTNPKQDEIGELTSTFNEMIERLRENQVLQQKLARSEHLSRLGQLSAAIAHEVRNPLNYLSLGLDQLKDGLAKQKDPERLRESVTRMKQEVLRLSHLVKNFLSYGKPLRLNRSTVDISSLVDDSIRMINDKVADKNIDIKLEIEPRVAVNGDREHLKSCVTNVLINAIDALSDGGRLMITANRGPDASSHVVISIRDNGCGIERDNLRLIGEPFYTTKDGGVGIGLAITKKIISEHDGAFEITSEKGVGTEVKISMPTTSNTKVL